MTGAGALLAASLAMPLAMLASCLSPRLRARVPALLAIAPLPALAAALLAQGGVFRLPPELLRATLALDVPGAILLGSAALLWVAAGRYATATLRGDAHAGRFAVWWLLTLTGSLGVFMAADLVSFYLMFAMVSLAAYGLVVHDGTARARRAGVLYVSLAVLGEALLLMGFVLLAAATPGTSLLIADAVAALPTSPWLETTLLLLILGFGLKLGLVPLHVWMPVAHPAAPIPASAVLSGVVVKAGVIGLIRFLPFQTALPGWGEALAAAGLFTAFYAVAVGITQANPKTALAYSTVSQMGLIATVLGMGLAGGDDRAVLGASLYASHHILVKGALFLAVGVVQATGARGRWPVLLATAVLALSLGGLPFTGGALAKLAVKLPLGDGGVGQFATWSAAGTTLLMLHFLARLKQAAALDTQGPAPARLVLPWLGAALASVAVPWALYLTVGGGTLPEALAPATLWAAAWPVLAGGVLALALWRWGNRLPRCPEGDVVVLAEGAIGAARAAGVAMERVDALLRQWPVAGVSLLALAVILAVAMLATPG